MSPLVHSATKWIGGHGTTIAGVIIDSGTTIVAHLHIITSSLFQENLTGPAVANFPHLRPHRRVITDCSSVKCSALQLLQ